MNSAQEKVRLRGLYAEKRALFKTQDKDEAIARNFLSRFCEERRFFIYCAFRTEAATAEIIRALIAQDKQVCVPKIAGKNMLAVPITDGLTENKFGIKEPACGEDTPVEIAVVPLLAVDERGNRLGYGGGYYDRYFAQHPSVYRVGLCYSGQVVKALPHEDTDIPLHEIITEAGARRLGE